MSAQDSRNMTGEHSLDDLAKGLASGNLSRRKALRMLGAAMVGGMLASIPGVALAAPCRRPRIRCAGQCCAAGVTTCQGTGRNSTCGSCPTGQVVCGGQCVDTSTDLANCGGCGNACAEGKTCQGGACVCPTGTTVCGNTCCAEGQLCEGPGDCPQGNACQTATCVGGVCAPLNPDPDCILCDAAGNCPSGQSCRNGICECNLGGICPSGSPKAGLCGLESGKVCAQDYDCCSFQCTGSNPNKTCA
jgi:hypothetical protein